jgi:hypothetical protein
MPLREAPMLKLLTRTFFSAIVLLLVLAAPSALAAQHSRRATSRAVHDGAGHHRNVTRKNHHGHRAIHLVSSRTGATISSAVFLGENTLESHVDYVIAGQAEAFRVQAGASDVAGIAHVYIDSHNAARTLIVGLYSNGAGHPGSLLSTGSVSTVQLAAWNSVSLTPTSLVSGKTYWLAVLGESGTLRYRDRNNGPCPSETSAEANLGALSASWKTGKLYTSCPASAYVTAAAPVFGPPVEPAPVEPPPVPPVPVEPAPAAPTNITPPAISGTPIEGHVLSVTNGTWNGSPTSYGYQWQDCDTSGGNCSNLSGATTSTYKLVSGDAGHTMRVVVTASNAGGNTPVTSAGTGPVAALPPLPPIASFTVTPVSPVAGQAVTLDGSSSSCSDGPCTYAWSDDGSTTRPIPPLWSLGSGQTRAYTFSAMGTKYVRLVVTDAKGQTATVEHNVVVEETSPPPPPPPPPPPTVPSNTAPPTVSGSAQVGQVLTATSGTWSGSTPIAYAYQWQGCNASGESCANISGATATSYTVAEADIGRAIRVVVTASNSAGSAPQASAPTAAVQGKSVGCTTTVTPSMSASAIGSTIVSAHDGDTICMGSGSYPSIHVVGATHGAYVTVRSAPGGTATVAGIEVANSSFLRFQGLRMTTGFNMRDGATYAGSHDYQFIEDTFEGDVYGIVLYGGSGPIRKVLIEHNYMRKIDFPGEACNPGYAGGQGVTIWYADGVTIAHNTFKEISWHYIQGGGVGAEGVTVDHNLFEGPIPADRLSCTHLNVWQIWDGGSNDTFSNNVVRGTRGAPAAVTPILFETGAGGGTCTASLSNSIITNNLFIYSSTAYAVQVLTTAGLTYTNNTSVGSEYGVWLDRSDTCGAGSNYNIQRNVSVENIGHSPDFAIGECTGTCIYDYNVSQDGSANGYGSTHSLTSWVPSFVNPIGYLPIGLPFVAGYQGGGGP